ncbi:MAG: M28 family peptidase [Methylophilales bacterium]|nr:M28 family peptidase [Methylophilales bacterium]
MTKKLFLPTIQSALFLFCLIAMAQTPESTPREKYAATITSEDLSELLYTVASDSMQGRMTGTEGQKMAADFLQNFYKAHRIATAPGMDHYFQEIPATYFTRMKNPVSSENVLAYIEGSELPDEVVVLSAHYDHVGMEGDTIYNGADDDGSGTVALLEIAEAFQMAKDQGYGPKRSLLFLHVTGEEIGLYGSRYYTENPIIPIAQTLCDLNTDMIGRIDPLKEGNENYIYLIGSDKLSQSLHDLSEEVNKTYVQLELDYTFNADDDPNRFYYRSDHYNFAEKNIPVIFYFNGVHQDYHKPTDTPDKINYPLMAKRTRLIFHTAWEIANREGRIYADKRTE